ncbi:MAG: phosphomannomutase/phosphoglucomutase, partial [Nanoarchaeota archaeon]|nr:phosphomannomutase/phosphoglucomutase [Nanoarchaeota archaeon]
GCEVTEMYCEPDGTFPNHHPDPTVKEYVQELIKKVKEEKADLGIGYDGDADRIGVISNTGEMLKGDQVLHIFARSILKENPGAIIVGEVKCSQTLYDDINKKGGKAVMWKTGHSLIKAKMREIEALLGGEMSGHIFFKHRWFGFDDAIYSSLRFLEILSESKNKDVEKLLHDIPKVHSTHEIKIKVEDETKFKIIEQIIHELKEEGHEVIDIDGARVIFTDGWGLIRCSNTTPYIMMRFEAETKERLDEIQEMFHKKVKKFV